MRQARECKTYKKSMVLMLEHWLAYKKVMVAEKVPKIVLWVTVDILKIVSILLKILSKDKAKCQASKTIYKAHIKKELHLMINHQICSQWEVITLMAKDLS